MSSYIIDDKKVNNKINFVYVLVGFLAPLPIRFIGLFSALELISSIYILWSIFNKRVQRSLIYKSQISKYPGSGKNNSNLWSI